MAATSNARAGLVSAQRAARGAVRRAGRPTAVLGLLMLAAGVLLLYAGRRLTFFYDEWAFVLTRRGGGIGTYLDPHNGHLSLVPVVIYKILFSLVGLRHYLPYRVVGIALHLLCAAVLYVLVRRRLGPWLALAPVGLLLFMGSAWQLLLWPFQIGYLCSIAGGLGALAVLERDGERRFAIASALLTFSVFSGGVGLAFLVAAAAMVVAGPFGWRRLWIVAVPAVLYALWYVGWGTGDESTSSDALLAAPQYAADAYAGTVAGVAGLEQAWAPALGLAFAAIVGVRWSRRSDRGPTPMLLGALLGAATFWLLAAVVRSSAPDPTASRYLYVGAVFVLLIAAEAGVGLMPRGSWGVAAGILLLAAVVGNIGTLRAGERSLRGSDDSVRASFRAIEVATPAVSPAFVPEPVNAPQLTAGGYLSAVHDLGSPALTLAELTRAPEATRARSDGVLEQAEALVSRPGPTSLSGTRPPQVTEVTGGRVVTRGGCTQLQPTTRAAAADIAVAPGDSLVVHAARGPGAALYLRRLASDFGAPFASVRGATSAVVRFPVDRAPGIDWEIRLQGSRLLACVG